MTAAAPWFTGQDSRSTVQNNIEVFGGDASNVTIFGQSAGSMVLRINGLATEPWPVPQSHWLGLVPVFRYGRDASGEERGSKLAAYVLPGQADISAVDLRAVDNETLDCGIGKWMGSGRRIDCGRRLESRPRRRQDIRLRQSSPIPVYSAPWPTKVRSYWP